MKRTLVFAILLIAVLVVLPASAQFRLGITGGSNTSSNSESSGFLEGEIFTSLAFGFHGEYKLSRDWSIFCAPLYANTYLERIDIPIGGIYRVLSANPAPYISGGLGVLVLLESPIPATSTDAEVGHLDNSATYNKLGLLFHVGIGVEFSSAARPLFSLELRARRGIISTSNSRGSYKEYTSDVSVLAGIFIL